VLKALFTMSAGINYSVTVGAGGANSGNTSANGSNSVFNTITSLRAAESQPNRASTQACRDTGGSGGGGANTGNAPYRAGAVQALQVREKLADPSLSIAKISIQAAVVVESSTDGKSSARRRTWWSWTSF
jgi:hypothetical protein